MILIRENHALDAPWVLSLGMSLVQEEATLGAALVDDDAGKS
jgi:hypothetical protein